MKVTVFLFILINLTTTSFGQSAKSYYKTGMEFSKNANFRDAIEQFTKAINLSPDYADAYVSRAKAYEVLGDFKTAADDYDRASVFITNDEELFYSCGSLYYKLGEHNKAIAKLERAINIKATYLPAYQMLAKSLIAVGNITKAKGIMERALARKNDADNNYIYGLTFYHLGDMVNAEKYFTNTIKKDDKYLDAYYELAKLKLENDVADAALNYCNEALRLNESDNRFYVLRSKIYISKLDLNNAITDISKVILKAPDSADYYYLRGTYYRDFKQFQNAINDFNKVLLIENENIDIYFERAKMYEEVSNFKAAIKDYETILSLAKDDPKTLLMLDEARKRLFDLNKEENKPVVVLTEPQPKNDVVINLPGNKEEVTLRGIITDDSQLKTLKINGKEIPFTGENEKSEFLTAISVYNLKSVVIDATDVYGNTERKEYTINWTETDAPSVSIIAPYASDNGEIYLINDDPNLYIEGKIKDESRIQTILVDGITASFKVDEFNPSFSATIGIQNKNKFTVRAIDEHGNESKTEFTFNREAALYSADNPMGKTWVVFIENSNYDNFPSLDGPAKDITSMRSALANYQVHNFIHKKDMSKSDMEKFFNIELRDLVRSNMVNSILIWYAGHGKFINETGYWIPIDANRDDEFSYFNTGNLKSSMQLYSKYITHLLLVTDACESGSTFYQAMRSAGEQRNCNDWQATRFKSSQVFTSAGYELAVDNSQFTKTFANTLANNPDACIPIETIVTKVTKAVEENNQQKPRFGKISGLEDENGTFFFITK